MDGAAARRRRRLALERQAARLERRLRRLRALAGRLSWLRLLLFVGGFMASGVLFFLFGPPFWLPALVVWLATFAVAVAVHRRVEAAIARHARWRDLKQAQLARMTLDWSRLPPAAALPPPPATHPFALDLDLSGERSLHHLLDTTESYDGSLRLQQRLLEQAPTLPQIAQRQALVRALRPLSLFRERLALQAWQARSGDQPWRAETLLAWVQQTANPQRSVLRGPLTALIALGLINASLLLLAQAGMLSGLWLTGGLLLYALLYLAQGRAASRYFGEALSLRDALEQMAGVFSYLERKRYGRVEPLQRHLAPFHSAERAPSDTLRALTRVVAAAGISRNPVLWLLLNAFFPWDLFFAYRLQRQRHKIADRLPRWLDAWFELETASALANLAYLNPGYTFPQLFEVQPGAVPFSARALGHPLIPHEVKVCNDYIIGAIGDVHIITGSNMAGKSSFLRTVGANLCLAYAGGAVDAASLQAGLFRLYTAIRVADSVTDGISYFYAEVKRLKALLTALQQAHPRPLMFLIDEIFRGTNNRERLLGSRAYIRQLVGANGLGLIATHDLELVHLANEFEQVSNFHFRDSVREGRMVFDYRLRTGPSPTTNALKVMAAAGLPVPPPDEQI